MEDRGGSMVDFTNFGQVISYQAKLLKRMEHNDPDRIKDYLCAGFSSAEPTSIEDHPCGDIIKKAVDILVKNGWKIGFDDWKTTNMYFLRREILS